MDDTPGSTAVPRACVRHQPPVPAAGVPLRARGEDPHVPVARVAVRPRKRAGRLRHLGAVEGLRDARRRRQDRAHPPTSYRERMTDRGTRGTDTARPAKRPHAAPFFTPLRKHGSTEVPLTVGRLAGEREEPFDAVEQQHVRRTDRPRSGAVRAGIRWEVLLRYGHRMVGFGIVGAGPMRLGRGRRTCGRGGHRAVRPGAPGDASRRGAAGQRPPSSVGSESRRRGPRNPHLQQVMGRLREITREIAA